MMDNLQSLAAELDSASEEFKTALITGQNKAAEHFAQLLDCIHRSVSAIEKKIGRAHV